MRVRLSGRMRVVGFAAGGPVGFRTMRVRLSGRMRGEVTLETSRTMRVRLSGRMREKSMTVALQKAGE